MKAKVRVTFWGDAGSLWEATAVEEFQVLPRIGEYVAVGAGTLIDEHVEAVIHAKGEALIVLRSRASSEPVSSEWMTWLREDGWSLELVGGSTVPA